METIEHRLKVAITSLEQATFGFDYYVRDMDNNDLKVAFNNLERAYEELVILKSEVAQRNVQIKFNAKISQALRENSVENAPF